MGNGAIIDQNLPVQVKGKDGMDFLKGIIDISASSFHSLALKADGTVWAWGANWGGQLTAKVTQKSITKDQNTVIEPWVDVAADVNAINAGSVAGSVDVG